MPEIEVGWMTMSNANRAGRVQVQFTYIVGKGGDIAVPVATWFQFIVGQSSRGDWNGPVRGPARK